MNESQNSSAVNRAKPYQLVLFPLNNGATNVYYVLVLSYIATFGSKVLALSMIFASVMVTGMRLFDAVTDPIIGALMDRTNGKFGKFRPFMVIGNLIMAVSILVLYCVTPLIPDTMMWARYAAFVGLYAVWVIGYRFVFARMALQQSCGSQKSSLLSIRKRRPIQTAPTSGQYGPRLLNLPETDTEQTCLCPEPKVENQPPLAAHTTKGGRRGTEIQSRRWGAT